MENIREVGPGGANGGTAARRGRNAGETEGASSFGAEAAEFASRRGGDGPALFVEGTDFLRSRFVAVADRLEKLLERHATLTTEVASIRGRAEPTPNGLDGEIADIERQVNETQVAFQNILTASSSENLDISGLMGEGDVTAGLNLQAMAIGHDNVLKLLEG